MGKSLVQLHHPSFNQPLILKFCGVDIIKVRVGGDVL